MAELHITVVVDGEQFLQYTLSPSTTVADLKALIAAESDKPEASQILTFNNTPLTNTSQSISDAGVKDQDMLGVTTGGAARQTQQSSSAAAATTSPQARAQRQPPAQPGMDATSDAQIEEIRQRILSDPAARSNFTAQMPSLASSLAEPASFRAAFHEIDRARREAAASREARLRALEADPFDADAQRQIEEQIRLENIQREMDAMMTSNPELYGRVTMLYIAIEINGHPVKAFVDSGAQSTIISPDCAEACGLTRLIDTRWGGVARGVGTARILGRIHRASMKIGYDEVPVAFTVMEGKEVDMLLGLDMLRRYQASIDLKDNQLRFPGGQSVPFLDESEIPKMGEEEEKAEGPGGAKIGLESGAVEPPSPASGGGGGGAAAGPSSGGANFRGAGQTLGSSATPTRVGAGAAAATTATATATPSASYSSSSSSSRPTVPSLQQQQQQRQQQQPARTTSSSSPAFPEADVQQLTNYGASRQVAIQMLQAAGGNVDMAMQYFLATQFGD